MTDASEISRMLAERIEPLCWALLPDGRPMAGAWRVGGLDGAKGKSLSVALTGPKRGAWLDFATGEKGDALDLVAGVFNCDVRRALPWARAWLGTDVAQGRRKPSATAPGANRAKAAPDPAETSQKALWLWRRRQSAAGTVVDTYLRKRGYAGVIPATLGFLASHGDHPPALIAAFGMCSEPEPGELSIADDDVRAVQLIKLKPDGSGKADIADSKIIVGQGALGLPIMLAPPNDLLGLVICEGVEDALSIHMSTGLGAWSSGGAGRMPALADAVPGYIDFVTIAAHRDRAGVNGADGLADGLRRRGVEHAVTFIDEGDA
jgi:hypothetical protein